MRPQLEPERLPRLKMALRRYRATAGPLVAAIANVLPKRSRARNRRLVDLLVLPDVVDGAVAGHGAEVLALGRARAVAGVFLDVVFNEGVRGPAVDGDEGCAGCCGCGAGEGDFSGVRVEWVVEARMTSMCGLPVVGRGEGVLFLTYLLVPVFHPFPTTKSPALENWTAYPLLVGLKLTLPLVL